MLNRPVFGGCELNMRSVFAVVQHAVITAQPPRGADIARPLSYDYVFVE